MTIKIQNKKLNLSKLTNIVIFASSNLDIRGLNKSPLHQFVNSIKKSINLNKHKIKDFFSFDVSPKVKVTLIKIKNENFSLNDNEKLGAKFLNFLQSNSLYENVFIDMNLKFYTQTNKNFFNEFLSGLLIKSYTFNKYKTKKNTNIFNINIHGNFKLDILQKNNKIKSLVDGVSFTKDLVSEPGNILHPDEYVNRIKKLKSFGLKVTIVDKNKLKQLGMNALLGVGQGSTRGSYLAIIEWKGSSKKQQPLAFVGKGVCFDTGGISLKPAKFMEDMTYDMAG